MSRRRNLPPPDFISKIELANHLRATTRSLDKWIAAGLMPPPHSRPGLTHAVWSREHYEFYKLTGEWPKDAWEAPQIGGKKVG